MLLFRRNALASCPRPAHTDRPTVLVDVCIDERLAEPGACMTVLTLFAHTVEAIRQGRLIERISSTDKEFHFQNWFAARLRETQLERLTIGWRTVGGGAPFDPPPLQGGESRAWRGRGGVGRVRGGLHSPPCKGGNSVRHEFCARWLGMAFA